MKRVFLVVAAAVALAACSDMFTPTPLPDLSKEPYDFSVVLPPYVDGGGAGGGDMKPNVPHDLSDSDAG